MKSNRGSDELVKYLQLREAELRAQVQSSEAEKRKKINYYKNPKLEINVKLKSIGQNQI